MKINNDTRTLSLGDVPRVKVINFISIALVVGGDSHNPYDMIKVSSY